MEAFLLAAAALLAMFLVTLLLATLMMMFVLSVFPYDANDDIPISSETPKRKDPVVAAKSNSKNTKSKRSKRL